MRRKNEKQSCKKLRTTSMGKCLNIFPSKTGVVDVADKVSISWLDSDRVKNLVGSMQQM